MKILWQSFALVLLMLVVQCKKETNSATSSTGNSAQDSASVQKEEEPAKPVISYTNFVFPKNKKDSAMSAFNDKYSKEEQYVILAINRLDLKNKWRADTLVIPNTIDSTLMAYSPFPAQLDVLKDVKKFVVFSYPIQAYAVYNNGSLQKWGPTSMGKKSARTKRGLMFTNWKKELAISTVNKNWKLPYNFNVENHLGIGWHEYDLPAYPASHSCLRLLRDDAKWMYNYGEQWILNKGGATIRAKGTPVIVFGDFDWDGKKPWKNLSGNGTANDISVDELNSIIQPHLDEILKEQKNREEVLSQINAEKTDTKSPTS